MMSSRRIDVGTGYRS